MPTLPDLPTVSLGFSPLTWLLSQIQSSGLKILGGLQTRWSHVCVRHQWAALAQSALLLRPVHRDSCSPLQTEPVLTPFPVHLLSPPVLSPLPLALHMTLGFEGLFSTCTCTRIGNSQVSVLKCRGSRAQMGRPPEGGPCFWLPGQAASSPVWCPFAGTRDGMGSCLLWGQTAGLIPT